VTFARYTGQENPDERRAILAEPPDILLTNYVMLELVLTRPDERWHPIHAAANLRFLVLDELHTYRGRQGRCRPADPSAADRMQIRRHPSRGDLGHDGLGRFHDRTAPRRVRGRDPAVGTEVAPENVIGETLRRATTAKAPDAHALRASVHRATADLPPEFAQLAADPLAGCIEASPEARFSAWEAVISALRSVLEYRLYTDLPPPRRPGPTATARQ
jgi:hypothetical protein